MFGKAWAAIWAAAAVLTAVPATAAETVPPIAAYGRLPSASHIVISPDGTRLAFLSGSESAQRLHVVSLADMKPVAVQPVTDWKVRSLRWAGSDHLLVTVSSTTTLGKDFVARRGEWFQLVDLDIPKNAFKQQMVEIRGLPHETLNVVAGSPLGVVEKGRPIAYVEGVIVPERKSQIALFRLDLLSGVVTQLGETGAQVRSWMLDPSGKPVARSLYNDETGHYALEMARGSAWRTVYSADAPIDSPYIAGLGREPGAVLLRVLDKGSWSTYDIKTDAVGLGSPIAGFEDGDIVHEPATGRPIAVVSSDIEGLHYRFFDPADQKRWDALVRAFKGETVELVSWSDDRSKIALLVSGPRDGAAYYLVDMIKHKAEFLVDQYADLPSEAFNEQRGLTYTAQDGLKLTAFLTLPHGRDPKDLPLVVLPHGGPASQDDPGFDWWAQAIASRGYAVLQPQFRGSDGLGEKLLAAGYGEWGRKMQTDLSDGVAELVSKGIADPKRVCIVGASYGGYAALAGVTLQHGIYRCAVAVAGPADLRRMIDEETILAERQRNTGARRYWARFMGAKSSADPALTGLSPALQAEKASAPVLLIHGKDDTVVPYGQSQEMAAALHRVGKPVEFVTLDHEDHWLSRGDTRLRMLTETLKFLDVNNPADPRPKPAAKT